MHTASKPHNIQKNTHTHTQIATNGGLSGTIYLKNKKHASDIKHTKEKTHTHIASDGGLSAKTNKKSTRIAQNTTNKEKHTHTHIWPCLFCTVV